MTNKTTVQKIRKALSTARGIERNWRLGLYDGRNSSATTARHERLTADTQAAMAKLPRELRGALHSEHGLASRISENRDMGQDRPELRARIAADRRRIKELTSAADDA